MVLSCPTRSILTFASALLLLHVHGSTCFSQKPRDALLTLEGHTSRVKYVTFSPDGKRLASASWDGTVKLWDVATGKEILTFKGHKAQLNIDQVWSVAFSPDGKWIASASYDQTVKLWDPVTGKELLSLKHPDLVYSMAVSPNGKRLASGSRDKSVRVWDTATGKKLLTLKGHTIGVVSIAFSPDGKRLASGDSDTSVKLWDPATGKELLTPRSQGAWSLAFSPDGKRLASATDPGSFVTVWNVNTGEEQLRLKPSAMFDDCFSCVTFRPDGQLLATGGFSPAKDCGLITLWDSVTAKRTRTLLAHKSGICSLAFSPDGRQLASSSENGIIKLWDVSSDRK